MLEKVPLEDRKSPPGGHHTLQIAYSDRCKLLRINCNDELKALLLQCGVRRNDENSPEFLD
jgi:hypothetical protein